jgi:N-methylhydantoinase B
MATLAERVVHGARRERASTAGADHDPVTTAVIRHGLISAAEQMKRTLVRTAVGPTIYEVLDFGVAIYDRQIRMLAQAESLPYFVGTMGYSIDAAVEALGGDETLEPGDIVIYNNPFGSGTHQNDVAIIMPVFLQDGELIGYSTIKAHHADMAGKDPYMTDTLDVFQEGTIFPGVKLFSRGEVVDDIWRMALANTRLPRMMAGDLNAQVAGVRAGAAAMVRLVQRFGTATFQTAVEHMLDHGERMVRSYFERIPDGRYVGHGLMDSNGLTEDTIPFEIVVEVEGTTVRVDYADAPEQQPGPINCLLACTMSASRCAIGMLSGASEAPHEGYFRPLEVVTRPGTMFHPLPPTPCFLGWAGVEAIEVIYDAIASALPEAVPAWSGGMTGIVSWGVRERTGIGWADGFVPSVGQGANIKGDGASALQVHCSSTSHQSSVEACETRNPWLFAKEELGQDSCGPGRYRGGLGIDFEWHVLEDFYLTHITERMKRRPPGLRGGGSARPSRMVIRSPDGHEEEIGKATRRLVPKGSTVFFYSGGGGGYGAPADRDPRAVEADVREGYISPAYALEHFGLAIDAA